MLAHYIVVSYLAYLVCPVWTAPESLVAFKCGPKTGSVCTILNMKFEDSTQTLVLQDALKKTNLNIKAGSIVALTMNHCESLRSFEKITIGPTGLGELCVAKTFRQVSAENNNIRTLHTTGASGDGDFHLELLKLNNNKLSSVESMGEFVALKELHLERNVLTTLDMTVFAKMNSLEKLFLGNNRLIKITGGAVELPKLSFYGLANNTLTGLNVQKWEMASLATLELAANNLTSVQGFEVLTALDKVTLAANSWECLELESMLEALQENAVTIADGDRGCDGIRNTSICCTVEANPSEKTLLDEMKNYNLLEERYTEATRKIEEQIDNQKKLFEGAFEKLQQSMKSAEKSTTKGDLGNQQAVCKDADQVGGSPSKTAEDAGDEKGDAPDEENSTGSPEGERCICSKVEVDGMKNQLEELLAQLKESNGTVTAALTNQPHLHRMALLTRHEFRTAVKRGEHKLREVHTKLAMLRDYMDNKLSSVV